MYARKVRQQVSAVVLAWVSLVAAGAVSPARASSDIFPLTTSGQPACVIAVGSDAPFVEVFAARELRRYVRQMSGVRLPIQSLKEPPALQGLPGAEAGRPAGAGERPMIVIGRPESNPLTAKLVEDGVVTLSADSPGLDGFVRETVEYRGVPLLVLGGSMARGTLYAVYDLLEDECGVGFFEDGDFVPRAEGDLAVPGMNVSERPRFPVRQNLQGCAVGYSTTFWHWEQWKSYIEYCAKRRFNVAMVVESWMQGNALAWNRSYRSMGVEVGEPTKWDFWQSELVRKANRYAHDLGIATITPGTVGVVPAELKKRFPDARYMEVSWIGLPPTLYLYPGDPLFKKLIVSYLREYEALYGPNHVYNFDPYPEVDPGGGPEEKAQVKRDYAAGVRDALLEFDPQARWYASGWGFWWGGFWKPEDVRDFVAALPNGMLVVADIWGEARPAYKDLDYFYGADWLFGIVHSFGGATTLHGDFKGLIEKVQAASRDPGAANLRGLYINPEIIQHNPIYFDLCAKLAWDPDAVDLDGFIADFCRRRYGDTAAPVMARAYTELTNSVYGSDDLTTPLYQTRLYEGSRLSPSRLPFLSSLRDAINVCLRSGPEPPESEFYGKDLSEMLRQYLGDLFGFYVNRMLDAFEDGDADAYQAARARVLEVFSEQERLLSSRLDRWLRTESELAEALPSVKGTTADRPSGDDDNTSTIRLRYSALAGVETDTLLDYARKDVWELLRGYYRPRLESFLQMLDEHLVKRDLSVPRAELDAAYQQITRKWVDTPLLIGEEDKFPGTPLDAVREIFPQVKVPDDEMIVSTRLLMDTAGLPVLLHDNFQGDLSQWQVVAGNWQTVNGQAHTNDAGRALIVSGDPSWTDYLVEATVIAAQRNSAGVVLRFQDAAHYYVALVDMLEEGYGLYMVTDNVFGWNPLTTAAPAKEPVPELSLGRPVHLQVLVRRNRIEYHVDGVLRCRTASSEYPGGQIGLWSDSTDASFDDITVYDLRGR